MKNEKDTKPEMADEKQAEKDLVNRRNFLRGLGKWSLAVIGGVALGAVAAPSEAKGWVNTRGGGGGGGSWANRGASWANGGGAWINSGGTWINGGGGGGWVNRSGGGGGGGSWVNRRGY